MKQIFILSIIIVVMSLIAFFLIPDSLNIFSFSGETFFKGQLWRLITFPFAHIGLSHLIENFVALAITSLLAFELGLRGKEFIGIFLLSGILIALADSFLFPTILIAGLSMGIYAVLGSLFHLAGFLTGISIFYLFIKLKKKPRILQMS